MERGDIYWLDLDPALENEANQRGPCLIVSNNASNRAASTLTVLPITRRVDKLFQFEVYLAAELDHPSKIQANQIRTISKHRVAGARLARLSGEIMQSVDDAMRLHLAI